MKREIVGSMSDWAGVLSEMHRQIKDGSLTLENFIDFTEHRNPFINNPDLVQQWKQFYKKYFNLELDFSNLKIPKKQPGFNRLIIIAQGLALNQVYNVCSQQFTCWKYADDLDEAIVKNERISEKSYAIWLRDRVEADEELKNMSANDLTGKNISGITLLERLIYELKFFDETSKHLDVNNITLCVGSRNSGGRVPCVSWYDGRLEVDWCRPQDADSSFRARAVVSF